MRTDLTNALIWLLCILPQGHLVTITSPAEQLYVEQLVMSAEYMNKVWIGIHSKKTNAPFKWVTGEPPAYTNWDDSHSPQSVGTTCAVMDPMSGGKWHDEWCKAPAGSQPTSYNFPFVVEYDCDTTVCGTVPEMVAVTEASGPSCKGKKERCWVNSDCCAGLACKGGSFMYCQKN
jgi:Lectin C-type domain